MFRKLNRNFLTNNLLEQEVSMNFFTKYVRPSQTIFLKKQESTTGDVEFKFLKEITYSR